jgi:F0F1-type ATP synthase membrane subunit b/b'
VSAVLANFLFEAINFLILAAALGYFFFKPVRSALDRERDARASADAEAARVRAEAEDLAKKALQTWTAADADIASHRERLLAAARDEGARLKEQARTEQAAERLAFDKQLRASRQAQTDDVASAIGEVAALAVLRLLGTIEGPDLDTALVRAACTELAGVRPSDGSPVEVESARPLSPDAVASLTGALGDGFVERIVPELGAGVRITTQVGQVDASAAAIARLAAREVAATGRGANPGGADE